MTSFLKLSDKLLVNLEHVTSIDFEPSFCGVNDEDGKEFKSDALLTFTLESVDLQTVENWEGNTVGATCCL